MILNAYAVLDVFISALRLFLGLIVLIFAGIAWRHFQRVSTPADKQGLEDRWYLLFLLAFLLLGLNIVSWPLLYLLLQSYVPQWDGVMCIYGVTQIGAGSVGPSRFLPGLLKALQLTKPGLVFLTGAWWVLYLINRQTRLAPLMPRTLLVLFLLGVLDIADAAAELAYLVIPKKEEVLSGGCCTFAFDDPDRFSRFFPTALMDEQHYQLLHVAYYGVNLSMVLLLLASARFSRTLSPLKLLPLLVGAGLAVLVNGVFLIEIAAPGLLGLPYHHCPYDLVPKAPESLLAVALFLVGAFAVGWAFLASCLGGPLKTESFFQAMLRRLCYFAALCILASVTMMSVELALLVRWAR